MFSCADTPSKPPDLSLVAYWVVMPQLPCMVVTPNKTSASSSPYSSSSVPYEALGCAIKLLSLLSQVGQAGWDSKHPGLLEGVLALGRRLELGDP